MVRIEILSNIRFLGTRYRRRLKGLSMENADILMDTLVPNPVYQSNQIEAFPCIQSHRWAYRGATCCILSK